MALGSEVPVRIRANSKFCNKQALICSYGQILTIYLLIDCKNSVIYGKMAVNYEGKSFMERAPGWFLKVM